MVAATTIAARRVVCGPVDANDTAIESRKTKSSAQKTTLHDYLFLLLVVHILNGSLRVGLIGEANKAEATTPVGVAVFDDNLLSSEICYGVS